MGPFLFVCFIVIFSVIILLISTNRILEEWWENRLFEWQVFISLRCHSASWGHWIGEVCHTHCGVQCWLLWVTGWDLRQYSRAQGRCSLVPVWRVISQICLCETLIIVYFYVVWVTPTHNLWHLLPVILHTEHKLHPVCCVPATWEKLEVFLCSEMDIQTIQPSVFPPSIPPVPFLRLLLY